MTNARTGRRLHFATVITASHLGYAKTVLASLSRHAAHDCVLHCLVVDPIGDRAREPNEALVIYRPEDLPSSDVRDAIFAKYAGKDADALRWSLKPVLMRALLERTGTAVAFVDPDQYFVADAEPLFAFNDDCVFRLSPHWRPIDPAAGPPFLTQLTSGLYNGGLFVARPGAEALLDWWSAACAWRCDKAPSEGLYVDQKYLDVVPIFFDGVEIIRHKGFNVASWNRLHLERRRDGDRILVGDDPLVCVHFSASTIRDIRDGRDVVLEPVLRSYEDELRLHDVRLPPPVEIKRSRLSPVLRRLIGDERAAGLRRLASQAKRNLNELNERLQR